MKESEDAQPKGRKLTRAERRAQLERLIECNTKDLDPVGKAYVKNTIDLLRTRESTELYIYSQRKWEKVICEILQKANGGELRKDPQTLEEEELERLYYENRESFFVRIRNAIVTTVKKLVERIEQLRTKLSKARNEEL